MVSGYSFRNRHDFRLHLCHRHNFIVTVFFSFSLFIRDPVSSFVTSLICIRDVFPRPLSVNTFPIYVRLFVFIYVYDYIVPFHVHAILHCPISCTCMVTLSRFVYVLHCPVSCTYYIVPFHVHMWLHCSISCTRMITFSHFVYVYDYIVPIPLCAHILYACGSIFPSLLMFWT